MLLPGDSLRHESQELQGNATRSFCQKYFFHKINFHFFLFSKLSDFIQNKLSLKGETLNQTAKKKHFERIFCNIAAFLWKSKFTTFEKAVGINFLGISWWLTGT